MNEQTLAQANAIKRDLELLTNYGNAIQEEQDNPSSTPQKMIELLSRSNGILSAMLSDTDSVNALNVVVENSRDAFKESIADSITQLNTALEALCSPQ